jgi:hypothetical protein
MKHYTAEEKSNQAQARSLLAAIQAAPDTLLPRRETIVEWLDGFLLRSDRRGYVVAPTEADDLNALEKFLRSHKVRVEAPAAV